MRRENSDFITKYISESGNEKENREYFGFVELEKYTCYVVSDSLDNSRNEISAKIVVDSIINDFTNNPTFSKRKLKKYVNNANEQLRIQSTNFKLSASVLIVVSDYQKLRYVSCGNTSLSIFRGNNIFLKSEEQSVYRHMVEQKETYNESAKGLLESKNLYNYLGKNARAKCKVSKKIKLMQDDVLFMSTWGFWNKVSDVEVLDALEVATDTTTFLGNAQDLLLSKQEEGGKIDSYSLITVFINKLYVDKSNKKKYIKIAIIVSIILLIILTIVLFFIYKNNKKRNETIDLITVYENKANIFLEDENYQRAFDQYTKAVTESENLKKTTGKKGKENTEIKERLDAKERVSSLILDGDNLYKDGDYNGAKNTYKRAISEINANLDAFSEIDIDIEELEKKMENCDDEIYLKGLLELGISQKDLEQYEEAYSTLEEAKKVSLNVGDKVSQKEVDLLLKEIASQVKVNEKEQEEKEKAEEEALKEEEDKQLEEEKTTKTKMADEMVISGENAVSDGNYDVAMDLYNNAMAVYRELLDTENMSKVQKLISELKVAQADSKNKVKYVEGDNFITVGDKHLDNNEFNLARNNYNKALKIFTELRDDDYMLICRTKLSDVDSAEKVFETELATIKANNCVKKGDEFLANNYYTEAKKQYKLAQIIYEEIESLDKVIEMEKKISGVVELENMEEVSSLN